MAFNNFPPQRLLLLRRLLTFHHFIVTHCRHSMMQRINSKQQQQAGRHCVYCSCVVCHFTVAGAVVAYYCCCTLAAVVVANLHCSYYRCCCSLLPHYLRLAFKPSVAMTMTMTVWHRTLHSVLLHFSCAALQLRVFSHFSHIVALLHAI